MKRDCAICGEPGSYDFPMQKNGPQGSVRDTGIVLGACPKHRSMVELEAMAPKQRPKPEPEAQIGW